MAYTKVNWQDTPSTQTPLNATNLNHMDDGIANALTGDNIKTTRTNNNNNTYGCDYINNLIGDVCLKSVSGPTSISITSVNGYGRLWVFGSDLISFIAFEGDGVNATIHDIAGTHQFTASTSGKVVTLSNLYAWDHYIFMGTSTISKIE